MTWMCTCLQILQRKVCHMLCVTCHRLSGFWEVVPQELPPPIFSFFRCSWSPNPPGAITREVLCPGDAEGYSPHGPQHLQQTLAGNQAQTPEPSVHKHHQLVAQTLRLFKSSTLKTADRVRSKRQGVVEMSLPSCGQLVLKHEREEQTRAGSCTAAVPPAGWIIPARTHNQTHEAEVKRWDYIKSALKSSPPHKEQSFILLELQEMLCSGSILSTHSLCKVTLSWSTDAMVLALKLQSKNTLFCHYRISKAPNSAATQGLQNTRDQHSLKNLFIQ